MIIRDLTLHNFRGIRDLKLDFDDSRMVLFAGINGAGKTSALECIATLMSWLVLRIRTNTGSGRLPSDSDIMNNENETSISLTIENGGKTYSWTIARTRKGRSQKIRSDYKDLPEIVAPIQQYLSTEPETAGVPLFVYYPVNRAVLDIPVRIRKKHEFTQLSAYEKTGTDFRAFFEWYRDQEDYENEQNRFKAPLFDKKTYEDKKLKAVRTAVYGFLPGFSELRVQRRPLKMVVRKSNISRIPGENDVLISVIKEFTLDPSLTLDTSRFTDVQEETINRILTIAHIFPILEVNQLSDGEKNLLALVGDLARRLALANPGLDNPLEGEGIVLIDEIELHQHPAWQRTVIPRLSSTFPYCQFFLTTHSPQVLSEAKNATIFGLEWGIDGIAAKRIEPYGKETNRILEDIMDTSARPENIRDMIRSYFGLIDEGRMEEAKKLRDDLEGLIGTDEPEFARADALIRRREILGR